MLVVFRESESRRDVTRIDGDGRRVAGRVLVSGVESRNERSREGEIGALKSVVRHLQLVGRFALLAVEAVKSVGGEGRHQKQQEAPARKLLVRIDEKSRMAVYRGTVPSRIGLSRRRPDRESPLLLIAMHEGSKQRVKCGVHERGERDRSEETARGQIIQPRPLLQRRPRVPHLATAVHVQISQRTYGCWKVIAKTQGPYGHGGKGAEHHCSEHDRKDRHGDLDVRVHPNGTALGKDGERAQHYDRPRGPEPGPLRTRPTARPTGGDREADAEDRDRLNRSTGDPESERKLVKVLAYPPKGV